MHQSALIVEVPWSESVVGPWRRDHDPNSHRGVPAHITILFPFRAPDALDDDVIGTLTAIATTIRTCDLSLVEVDSFPDAVWLRPDPDDHLHTLGAAVWSTFPDCPPHGGRFPALRPHVTIGQSPDPDQVEALRARAATELAATLPVSGPIEGLSLFVSDESGEWSRRRMFPFASRA